jgi:hypothetical protein
MIKSFDRNTCRLVQDAVMENMKEFCDEHGLSVKMERGTFSPENATLKFSFAVKSPTGETQSRETLDFKRYASQYGLSPSDLNKTFSSYSGDSFEVAGLRIRAYKRPILGRNVKNGKMYCFDAAQVLRGLGVSNPARVIQVR